MAKKRNKGGRKPVEPEEKVILVGFYTKRKHIENVGGMDRAREIAKTFIENYGVAEPYSLI